MKKLKFNEGIAMEEESKENKEVEQSDAVDTTQYDKLLDEFTESRKALKKMIDDVEECKRDVLKSVVDSNDYRNKYAREERLKTLSSFFDTEIKVRQEYGKSILAEIDIRRKLDRSDKSETEVDVREIAKQLMLLNKKAE